MLIPSGLIGVKVLSGKQTTITYVDTLKIFCVPIMNLYMAPKIWLVQVNCNIHVAKFAKSYFETQNFELIECPAKSPDLNLMENIWKMFSDIIYSNNQPRNLKELRLVICHSNTGKQGQTGNNRKSLLDLQTNVNHSSCEKGNIVQLINLCSCNKSFLGV